MAVNAPSTTTAPNAANSFGNSSTRPASTPPTAPTCGNGVGRIEETPRHKPKSPTAEERQQWLAALESSEPAQVWDLPDLSLMMLATGCRIGECLAIGWQEVNLDQATVDGCWRLVRRTGVGLLRPALDQNR